MKVSNHITLYAGTDSTNLNFVLKKWGEIGQNGIQKKQENQNSRSLYAGNLNNELFTNNLQQKKKDAQEKAMKVIADAWAGDRAIDEDLQARAAHIDELQAENKKVQAKINDINRMQEDLKGTYGITGDSEEQQELELIRRKRDLYCKGGGMTQEEFLQAVKAEANGLTEYQQRQLELDDEKEIYQETIDANQELILEENAIISGTKQERLKHSSMTQARNQAENILEAASEEIIGMAMEEAKEHVDEEQEQREEKRDGQEEIMEEMPMEELLHLNQAKVDIQKEVKNILSEMKLVAEDIKGAMVDESL